MASTVTSDACALVTYRVRSVIFTDSITPFTRVCHYSHREIGLALPLDRRLIFSVADCATVPLAVANIARISDRAQEVRRNAKIRKRNRRL